MNVRLPCIALLAVVFAAGGVGAFGQSVTSASSATDASIDALPKHPIPYKAFKKIGAKPKPNAVSSLTKTPPAFGTSTAKPLAPASAVVVKPPASPTVTPHPQLQPLPPKPTPILAPAPNLPAPNPAATPAKTPLSATAPVAAALTTPALQAAPRPTAPKPVFVPPPPQLLPAQLSARLQAGQALPGPELEAFIDGEVGSAMAADHIAGVAVAVVQNGQLVMEKGYGRPSPSPSHRIDPRATLVRLGSASQVFTWIAALKAVEDGKLNLDAPVNHYLPEELKLPDEGFDRPVLFRHLMSHTAGFEDRALGRRYVLDAGKLAPLDDALSRLRPRRVRAAGRLSIPSDYGVALAGDIVAKVEGQPFDQLIETEILKPLALSHTSFREPYPESGSLPAPLGATLANGVASGFIWTREGWRPQPFAYGQSLAPAIAASTTADDMARLMIALLNNGRLGDASLYGPKTARLLRTPLQRPAPGMDGWAHGLTMQQFDGGFEALSDVGSAPAFQSNLTLTPRLNLGIFVVANTDTKGALTRSLPAAIVHRFYANTPAPPANGNQDGDYAGAYLSAKRAYHGLEAFADRLTLQSKIMPDDEGALILRRADDKRFSRTPVADQFRSDDGAELFAPTANGRAQIYVLGSGGGAAERVGGVHSRTTLAFWGAATILTLLASFAGLFIRDRVDRRETRAQITANVTQVITCVVWCLAFFAFYLFAQNGLSAESLMFDWPNRWLVIASWAALIAGSLTMLMVTQLPGAWREERRIHGWPVWRKVRHTATVAVFLIFTAVLAAWGALEPWSS